MSDRIKWACPKCGATPDEHGKGGIAKCENPAFEGAGYGFLCDCDGMTSKVHGETLTDRCESASCGHCGWSGTFPPLPKKLAAWEKKALEAGWTPPPGFTEGQ